MNSAKINRSAEEFVPGSMLLVLPVPFRRQGDKLLFEKQACNGLNRWADHFSMVIAAAPQIPEEVAAKDRAIVWEDTNGLHPRITCIPLPWAYTLPAFLRSYQQVKSLLDTQIERCEYLQFAIGGLVGDWAAIAAREAIKRKRRFAIHTDRVESNLLRALVREKSGPRAWKISLEASLMDRYHRSLISHCSAGLWHGQECYSAYAPWSRNNYLIHDVHTKPSDGISAGELQSKLVGLASAEELRIVYAGRMAEMKAPLEWLSAIARARDLGVKLRATWFGDGELRGQMESEIARLNLGNVVRLTGFVSDRQLLLKELRDSHAMVFTHITPESPRCLLESLISGTPIIGYDNPFARDLTASHGGGTFVPIHDSKALGERIAYLSSQLQALRALIAEAAENGRRFNDQAVFGERSHIIKTVLSQNG
jgi:glycosyltransferase involved in cell wall biosynthesis